MPPIRNVSEIVVSTLMPISRAASGSCAVARIALPRREREMKRVITSSSGIVTPIASTSPFSIVTPKIVTSVCCALMRSTMPSCDAAQPQEPDVLQDERHAHGGDQRRELRRAAQRSVGDPLDQRVENPRADHRHDQRRPGGRRTARTVEALVQPERPDERGGDERADHEHLAVGEVDQLDDAVDERVTDRHQRPDGAVGDPGDDVLAQPRQVPGAAEVIDRERHGQCEQDDDQPVRRDECLQSLGGGWTRRDAGGFHVVG